MGKTVARWIPFNEVECRGRLKKRPYNLLQHNNELNVLLQKNIHTMKQNYDLNFKKIIKKHQMK